MSKVLSQAGISLADIYDVEGSIAGVEQLDAERINLVHEMGSTIFSERISSTIRELSTAAILQNTTFDLELADLPSGPTRILGITVLADGDRVSTAQVSVRDPVAGREVPIFVYDTALDSEPTVRIMVNGAAIGNQRYLRGEVLTMPTMIFGAGQPQRVPNIVCRGVTSGFGAGTVIIVLLVHLAFSQVGGISSFGLPLPGW